MHIRPFLATAVLLLATAAPTRSFADPITLTSGSIVVGSTSGHIDVAGDGFSFTGTNEGGVSTAMCGPCAVGETASFNTYMVSPFMGTATVGGDPFTLTGLGSAGEWTFTGPSFTFADSSASSVTFSGLFSFDGWLSEDGSGGVPAMPRVDLIGSGLASATYSVFHDPSNGTLFTLSSLRFDFGNSPSPTPEPASILLLGSGIAAGLGWRRRVAK